MRTNTGMTNTEHTNNELDITAIRGVLMPLAEAINPALRDIPRPEGDEHRNERINRVVRERWETGKSKASVTAAELAAIAQEVAYTNPAQAKAINRAVRMLIALTALLEAVEEPNTRPVCLADAAQGLNNATEFYGED